MSRDAISKAKRIVIKVGSSSLTTIDGGLDVARLVALVDALSIKKNVEIVLVSSGAIAAGLAPLGLNKRPTDLSTQQAAASVGQGRLMAEYSKAFEKHNKNVGQVLLTVEDVTRRTNYNNAKKLWCVYLNLEFYQSSMRTTRSPQMKLGLGTMIDWLVWLRFWCKQTR